MSLIAEWIGVSKQAMYKSRTRFDHWQDLREQIVEFVKAQRLINKTMGGVKLHQCFVREHPPSVIGRDRFLTVLRNSGLLLRRKRVRQGSSSSVSERQNRQDFAYRLTVVGPGHLWVQDETEVVTFEGKAHLALSTDAYSHKVVGYSWSKRATTQHVEKALSMGLSGHVHGPMRLIHPRR